MKTLKLIFAGLLVFTLSPGVFAQPPNPPDSHQQNNNQSGGGGAPLHGELILFVGIGLAWGGIKVYKIRKAGNLKELQ